MKTRLITLLLLGLLTTAGNLFAAQPTTAVRQMKSVNSYYPNGERKGELRSLHTFVEKGHLVSYKRFYPNGALQEEHLFTYDRKGHTTSVHSWNYRRGFSETLRKYELNGKGLVLAIHNYQNGAYVNQEHYIYRKKKGSLHYVHDPSGKLIYKEEIQSALHCVDPLALYPPEENAFTEREYFEK